MTNTTNPSNSFLLLFFRVIIISIALCSYLTATAQIQYYVKPNGSNGNSGLSIDEAWQTIQYAANNLSSGQAATVNILGGSYQEKINIGVSGAPNNYITFQNYENSTVIIHNSGGIGVGNALLRINNQSYLIIQGLNLIDNQAIDAQGILIEGSSHHIEIRNNAISEINFSTDPNLPANENRNSQPLIVYGNDPNTAITDLIIDGNTVFNSRTGYSEALAVNGNVDGFEVTNNMVFDITNIGIDIIGHEGTSPDATTDQARNGLIKGNTTYNCISPYAAAAGIYVDGGRDLVIEGNTVYQNQWGIEVGCENIGKTTSNITIRNNFIYNNEKAAIAMGGFDFPNGSGKVTDCLFINNTCFNNDAENDFTGEFFFTYTENCSFRNNIFYANNTQNAMLYSDVTPVNLIFDYNIFYTSSGMDDFSFEWGGDYYNNFSDYKNGTGNDANSIFINPLLESDDFVNPDLHIMSNSPAIDSGDPNFNGGANETDIDGNTRILMGQVDIGADEYQSVLAVEYLHHLSAIVHANQIELNWQTATEIDHDFFIVEKSNDAKNWTSIGQVSCNERHDYRFFDKNPSIGESYYRLQQVAKSGQSDFSAMVSVFYEKAQMMLVYPNPINDFFKIKIEHKQAEKINLELYDWNGKLVKEQKLWTNERISIKELEPGIYLLKIRTKTSTYKEKIVVLE